MLGRLKQTAKSVPSLVALNCIRSQFMFRMGLKAHASGSTHQRLALEDSVRYIESVVDDYLTYSNHDSDWLRGKRIVEVGPGDNLGVALLLIAKGAESVTAFDRFQEVRDSPSTGRIYQALLERLPQEEQKRLSPCLKPAPGGGYSILTDRVRHITGHPIEHATRLLKPGDFDVVVSRAVLEHVISVNDAWQEMTRLLAPDGEMWHKVDLRAHNLFTQFHPLYFLTFKQASWGLISSPDPTLNRTRADRYRELAEKYYREWECYYTHVIHGEEIVPHVRSLLKGPHFSEDTLKSVESIRSRLQEPYRTLPAEDLLVSGIFLICRHVRH